jgi:RNA polymerase sigma factor (sigma-70 family)
LSKEKVYTDRELIEGLANSDNQAISEIYSLYQPMLLKWMVTRGGTETDAYDVFQEGVLVLFEKTSDPEFALTCKLSTYLFAVCKRIWFKKNQKQSNISSLDYDLGAEEGEFEGMRSFDSDIKFHQEQEAKFEQLEQSLEQLGNPCKGLLKAFYIEEKSMQEIASVFGYTNAENAKTQKYKCLNRLKKLFFSSKMMLNV